MATLVAALFGTDEVRLAEVTTPGMETQAFRVTDGQRTGCLRIGSSLRGFRKDAWAHEVFGGLVPVPAVWRLGDLADGSAYCLTEWASGRTLQDLTSREVNRITPIVFDAWSRLQTEAITETSGFGDLDPDTMTAPYASHHDRLRAALSAARQWSSDWVEARADTVARLLESYESLIDDCPDERAFVHGDWGTNNLIAGDEHLTAVLDWETAGIGDPLQDISGRFWAFWPPVTVCVSALAAYADQQLGHLPNYAARVLCYDLLTGIDEITDSLDDGNSDSADRCLNRCLELLDAYHPTG